MKVAVIGCGWFGFPLAKALKQNGYEVVGSKQSWQGCQQLMQHGIDAIPLNLPFVGEPDSVQALIDVDAMVINIPPGLRRGDNDYLERLESLKSLLLPGRLKRLIFVSTTGVYPGVGDVCEEDAQVHSPGSETLLAAEALFANANTLLSEKGQSCILRFAGLVGPGRHPGRFLAGKQSLKGANQSVNLVHLDDCISACLLLLSAKEIGTVYNLCTQDHSSKKAFYTKAALALDLVPPEFGDEAGEEKKVLAHKICDDLGFRYQYDQLEQLLLAC